MADYATEATVQRAAGGVARLVQIADQDDSSEIDSGLIDAAIDEAESLIHSYVRKVRATPVSPAPTILVTLASNLAVYVLKGWRDALTESDQLKHEQRIAWLEGVAARKIDLGVSPTPSPSANNPAAATDRPSSKAVSRENLKGFS